MSLAIATVAKSPFAAPPRAVAPCPQCPARSSGVCAGMPSENLGALAMIRTPQRVASGEIFIDEGEAATHFFNIIQGWVKVYKLLPDGRRQITGFLTSGDFLGLAFNEAYTYSAEALTEVSLCRFPRRQLTSLLERFPSMERRLLAIASNELAAAQEQMVLLGRKTAQERIASFILGLARREERQGRNGAAVKLSMTRSDIADYLGLTTETVSRIFTALRGRRAIKLETGGVVVIADREACEELAEAA